MKKLLLVPVLFLLTLQANAQCAYTGQITTADSVLCAGDSTLLTMSSVPDSVIVPTPLVNNNGQDGNMFDITATNAITIRWFEGNIANTPNATTDYYIYYKIGTHVGSENNAAAWTLIAGPVQFNPNTPNTLTRIPVPINITIPAGQTYAFYLTNTSAISNNNRYHNGTATGTPLATNSDLTVFEGTGGAYPFGTFFNARPWEGNVIYEKAPSFLWNTGATSSAIMVAPATTMDYSCQVTYTAMACVDEDTISVTVNPLPVIALGNDTSLCPGFNTLLDAGYPGSTYMWCGGQTTQTVAVSSAGMYCVTVTDINGCSDADSLTVMMHPQPFIAALGDTICAGETANMFVTGTAFLYNWMPGSLTGNVVNDSPLTTTTYTIVGTDGNGCTDTTNTDVVVNQLPVISVSSFGTWCLDDNTVILSGASPIGGTYSGPGVNVDSLYPSVAGAGTHVITYTFTDSLGCANMDTASITIDLCLDVAANVATNAVSVYPNPMNESAILQIDNSVILVDAQLSLYDVNGALVRSISSITSNVVTLDRDGLSAGVYFFTLINNGGELATGKLVIE